MYTGCCNTVKFENTGDTLRDENEMLKRENVQRQLGMDFMFIHFHSDAMNICKCINCRYVPDLKLFSKVNKKEVGWE
jgi:hypothetical protein